MRAVVQRVTQASVTVDGEITGSIDKGVLILVGVGREDTDDDASYLAKKIWGLRIFEDDRGLMNLSLSEVGGQALVVSQFTLYGDVKKGRRPSWNKAGPPELANELYERFCVHLRALGCHVETGIFQATMAVSLVNDGPVTLLIDSEKQF